VTTKQITVERFKIASAKPFAEVARAIEAQVGHPDIKRFYEAIHEVGIAYASNLNEGESFTTLELKFNFLKPIWNARLRATGRVVKQGRTVGMVECNMTDEKGGLVAWSTITCMTLSGAQADGR